MSEAAPVQRLLDAVMAISSDLSLPVVLRRIVAAACDLVDAQYGALGVIGPGDAGLERGLVEFITVGADEETVRRIGPYPQGRGVLGLLVSDAEPLRLRNLQEHPSAWGFPANHPQMRSFLGVPIRIHDTVFGNLYLTEKRGADEFSKEDEDLAVALASAAAVAIENARLLARVEELAVVEERERIARDLHDVVLQRLFATGIALQVLESRAGDAELARALHQAVADLDGTVRDIRGAIFALNAYELGERSLRVLTLALAAEARGSLGFEPRVHFEGPVDAVLAPELAAHLHATLREVLSNVARHAGATTVDVLLTAGSDLALRVVDNGRGMGGDPKTGNGLRNIAARAQELGGRVSVEATAGGGTTVEWRVPLRAEPPKSDVVTRVMLCDDHDVVRSGLRALLQTDSTLRVVGEAGTADEAVAVAEEMRPDVVVMDVRMPGRSGIEACRDIRSAHPETRVLMLTSFADDEALFTSIMAGASGYVLKQIRGPELLEAIRRVARGESLLDSAITERVLARIRGEQQAAPAGPEHLTPQERRILDLVGEGLTNRQIGDRLHLAEKTVKNHVTGVLAKLGLSRRTEAAVYVVRRRAEPGRD